MRRFESSFHIVCNVQFALVLAVSIVRFVSINYNFEMYDIFHLTSIAKRKTIGCNYFATRWKKSRVKKDTDVLCKTQLLVS